MPNESAKLFVLIGNARPDLPVFTIDPSDKAAYALEAWFVGMGLAIEQGNEPALDEGMAGANELVARNPRLLEQYTHLMDSLGPRLPDKDA